MVVKVYVFYDIYVDKVPYEHYIYLVESETKY